MFRHFRFIRFRLLFFPPNSPKKQKIVGLFYFCFSVVVFFSCHVIHWKIYTVWLIGISTPFERRMDFCFTWHLGKCLNIHTRIWIEMNWQNKQPNRLNLIALVIVCAIASKHIEINKMNKWINKLVLPSFRQYVIFQPKYTFYFT